MLVYIASTLENAPHIRQYIHPALQAVGHTITYDWTTHGSVFDAANLGRLAQTAEKELAGLEKADLVLVLLPGGHGTHTELGMALALGKRIWLFGQPTDFLSSTTCVFYHLDQIERRESFVDCAWHDDLFAAYGERLRMASWTL